MAEKFARVSITESFAAAERARALAPRTPQLSVLSATLMVMLTVLIMAYSALVPVVPILLLFLLWLPQPFLRGMQLLRPSYDALLLLVLPLLAAISTVWSDYPSLSLYYGIAFSIMMVCVLIMSRAVPFVAWVNGLVSGAALTVLVALASHQYQVDPRNGSEALIGYFGSKNITGFFAEIGIVACAARVMFKGSLAKWLMVIPVLLLCVGCLYLSRSGTALLSLVVALAFMVWAYVFTLLPQAHRAMYSVFSMIAAALLVFAVMYFHGQSLLFDMLGKDETMTGRTYLWEEGMKVAQERPLLGHGYGAFWVPGQPQAEQYWQQFFIADKAGFHFHNSYIQAAVDLGLTGAAWVVLMLGISLLMALRALWRAHQPVEAVFLVGLAVMLLVRSVAEVDILGPFSIGVMLFYAILPRARAASQGAATDGAMTWGTPALPEGLVTRGGI